MIECCENNIWYNKKRPKKTKKRRKIKAIIIAILIIVLLVLYYKFCVISQIVKVTREYAYSYSTDAVNKAVLTSVNIESDYNQLVSVTKNNAGEIELISFNSQKINKINREIADHTNMILSEKLKSGIKIPLFAFMGIGIISGYGPPINFKTLSVSSVVCEFKGHFESVGINQTRHSLYISVLSNVCIDVPMSNNNIKCTTDVLLCEAVLVGKVPDVYLENSN